MTTMTGERLDLGSLMVDRGLVDAYLLAVGDTNPIHSSLDTAPPLALAAHVLSALIEKLALPPGTIHAAQEIECHGLVSVGQEVSCQAQLSRPMRRGDWSIMAAQFQVTSPAGITLLDGKTTVMVPDGRGQLD